MVARRYRSCFVTSPSDGGSAKAGTTVIDMRTTHLSARPTPRLMTPVYSAEAPPGVCWRHLSS